MSNLVEIPEGQAARLQQIATEKGVSSDVLLVQALELLFRQTDKERVQQEEQEYLRQLEAEGVSFLPTRARTPFNMENVVVIHSVPVDPASLRRL